MKYMIEYTIRSAGLTHDEGFAGGLGSSPERVRQVEAGRRFDGPRVRLEPGR